MITLGCILVLMNDMKKSEDKYGEIFLLILLGFLIYIIITASTLKKPKKQETRMAHPVAYMSVGDSVKVYFVWEDSVSNKVFSADTSVIYHINNKPDFKTNVEIKIK